jgi:hypothetical protein
MTADEFLAWAEAYDGDERLELIGGHIVPKYAAMPRRRESIIISM